MSKCLLYCLYTYMYNVLTSVSGHSLRNIAFVFCFQQSLWKHQRNSEIPTHHIVLIMYYTVTYNVRTTIVITGGSGSPALLNRQGRTYALSDNSIALLYNLTFKINRKCLHYKIIITGN